MENIQFKNIAGMNIIGGTDGKYINLTLPTLPIIKGKWKNMSGNYANQTGTDVVMSGAYWISGNADYSTGLGNATGVNPDYVQYLSPDRFNPPQQILPSTGYNSGNDPFNDKLIKSNFGGNFNLFWETVFPQGTTDCDLAASIQNITSKIASFQYPLQFPSGGVNNFAMNWTGVINDASSLHLTAQQYAGWLMFNMNTPNSNGITPQMVADYIVVSHNTLQSLLNQYQGIYNAHIAAGGGCSNGVLTSNFVANQNTKTQAQLQLQTQQLASNQSLNEEQAQAVEAANAAAQVAAATTQAANAAEAPAITSSPVNISLIIGGLALLGIVGVILAVHGHKGTISVAKT